MAKQLNLLLKMIRGYRELSTLEGGLLPFAMAAKMMGISKQRVSALIAEGTLKPVDFAGKKWLTGNQIEEFVKLERASGRPWHKPSTKELWKMSREGAEEQINEK